MSIIRAIFRITIGAIFGILVATSLSPALAAFVDTGGNNQFATYWTILIVAIVALLAGFAPSIRRAFGRGFLTLGASLIVLPISAMMLSGRAANEVIQASAISDQGAAAFGAGLAGIAFTGMATFLGLILGGICLIIGLVLALGGRREVIVVERAASSTPTKVFERKEPRF